MIAICIRYIMYMVNKQIVFYFFPLNLSFSLVYTPTIQHIVYNKLAITALIPYVRFHRSKYEKYHKQDRLHTLVLQKRRLKLTPVRSTKKTYNPRD